MFWVLGFTASVLVFRVLGFIGIYLEAGDEANVKNDHHEGKDDDK